MFQINVYIYVCVSIAGICLFLDTSSSAVNAYNCHNFSYGCPSYQYFSSAIYERKHITLIFDTGITNVTNQLLASYNCILPYKTNIIYVRFLLQRKSYKISKNHF